MRTDDLDFELPPELIAQSPPPERSASRLLHYRRSERSIEHRTFAQLPSLLRPGDLLVFNDTRVVPARFTLRKSGGGYVEALFLTQAAPGRWRVMLKNVGAGVGIALRFDADAAMSATVVEKHEGGEYVIEVHSPEPALHVLARLGRMPLPPYIKREKVLDPRDREDLERYQTVYAHAPGAVAAPTAGLHFTPELFEQLDRRQIEGAFVTLHVGLGTFKPVTADTLEGHAMHAESYEINPDAAAAINRARRDGRRVIAVGTTSARVLESQPPDRPFEAKHDQTSIFIYPPYRWRHVDALITNFHLPRSTLLALVAAMIGLDEQRRAYAQAIAQRYRFFSYGDAMLIE
ncbi:MAG TPA: tRNA preQ1(34) S-adenosylmethionine ribosyltransferase-isomerase QueA [Tepidisphaeraceae bacterium]